MLTLPSSLPNPNSNYLNRFLLLFCLLFCLTLSAQRKQGDVWIDGATSWQIDDPAEDFILDGGAFALDGLLLGLYIRADNERLFDTYAPPEGVERYELFARYYPLRTARWSPYVELGLGALTNAGSFRSLRPTLGIERELVPGAFGRLSVGYEYTEDYQTYTLEVGSSIGFNDWFNKERIPAVLAAGQWLINSHLASITLLDDGLSPDGVYGAARVNIGYVIQDYLLLDVEVNALRQSVADTLTEPARIARNSITADVGIQWLALQRSNFINPYLGIGGTYGRTEQEAFRTDSLALERMDTAGISPYITGGGYLHVSNRISLRADLRWYARRYSPLESPWQFRVGAVFRFGRYRRRR